MAKTASTAVQRRPGESLGDTPIPSWRQRMLANLKAQLPKSYLLIVLAAVIVLGSILSPYFFSGRNINNVLIFGATTAILGIGQFFVIVTGGIDLSVGSIVALATVVVSVLLEHGMSMGEASLVTLGLCGFTGLLNGFMVVVLGLTPFIATLAMLSIAQGAAYMIQSTTLIQINSTSFATLFFSGHVLGVPNPIVFFIVVTLLAVFLAHWTTFGRRLYAIGGNLEAARLSGLPVSRDLMCTYTLSGLLAGLAGLLAAGQLLEGSSLIGQGYELNAIAAVVVGGASLFGGTGSPFAAVLGGLIIGVVDNILNLLGVQSQPQLVIQGLVIVVAVFFSSAGGVRRISSGLSRLRPASVDTVPDDPDHMPTTQR